jgi:protein TonB
MTSGRSGGAASGRSTAKAEAAYLAALQRAIARHQRFPNDARRRRQTGVVTLSFVVQGDGRIRQVSIAKSSGEASLDEAAVQAMKRLNRFKPIPAVIGRREWAMRVPIRFDLK